MAVEAAESAIQPFLCGDHPVAGDDQGKGIGTAGLAHGARGIAGVTVIAEQPEKWTAELEKYFGPGSVTRDGTGIVADTGTQPIRYLARQDYLARYPGITPVRPGDHPALLSLRVDRLATCEALLAKNGVRALKPDAGRLLVPPSEAAHLTIEFVQ